MLKYTRYRCQNSSPQAWPSPDLVWEDCIWTPGWPRKTGDWAGQNLSALTARPCGHAGCHCSDGNATVHQQWAAESGRAFHHPLWSPHRSPVRWWKGSSESQGHYCRVLNSVCLKASFQSNEEIFFYVCVLWFGFFPQKYSCESDMVTDCFCG